MSPITCASSGPLALSASIFVKDKEKEKVCERQEKQYHKIRLELDGLVFLGVTGFIPQTHNVRFEPEREIKKGLDDTQRGL